MRDLLRGDPDTDVTIVFDREENAEYVKQELKLQQQQDQEQQEQERIALEKQQQQAAEAEALVAYQQQQQQQLQTGGPAQSQLGRQPGLGQGQDVTSPQSPVVGLGAGIGVGVNSGSFGGATGMPTTPRITTPTPVSLSSAQRMLTSLAPLEASPIPPAVVTRAGSSPTMVRKTVTFKRQLVRMSDVRLATLLGDPNDGIGYINLSGRSPLQPSSPLPSPLPSSSPSHLYEHS